MTRLIKYFDSLNKILDDKEIREIVNAYNAWINSQHESIIDGSYCDAFGRYTADKPHHVRCANNAGTGIKPHDLWKVPLTHKQHQNEY